jgi:hypothetical protein
MPSPSTVRPPAVPRPVWLWALAVCWLLWLPACATEKVISADDLMPAQAEEEMPPRDFVEDVLGSPSIHGQFWMRGCKYPDGWGQLTSGIGQKARENGYIQVSYHSEKLEGQLKKLGCNMDDFFCLYQSPGATVVVGALNIKLVRDKGGTIDGLADYVLFGGTDHGNYPPHP